MSTPSTQARNLYQWLEIATAELIPPSEERIRLEIEAHFADSMESRQANGCLESEARRAALAELGDPIAAAKRFRRKHLTVKEAKRVGQMLNGLGPARLLAFWAFFALCSEFSTHRIPRIILAAALFMCVTIQIRRLFEARRQRPKPDVRLIVLMHVLYNGCFVALLMSRAIWTEFGVLYVGLLLLSAIFIRNLHLWFKLGQVDNIWPTTPSRGAPAP